jgi:predicted enzyme related to lactoylglutathione lyase
MIKGVHSTVIWTDDLSRLTAFYRDTMGMTTEMESPEFVVFAGAPSQLALGRHSEVAGPSKDPYRVMVDLIVDDCQAEYERLKAKGVEFLRPPGQDQAGGFTIATLRDIDGNTLQLFQLP